MLNCIFLAHLFCQRYFLRLEIKRHKFISHCFPLRVPNFQPFVIRGKILYIIDIYYLLRCGLNSLFISVNKSSNQNNCLKNVIENWKNNSIK